MSYQTPKTTCPDDAVRSLVAKLATAPRRSREWVLQQVEGAIAQCRSVQLKAEVTNGRNILIRGRVKASEHVIQAFLSSLGPNCVDKRT